MSSPTMAIRPRAHFAAACGSALFGAGPDTTNIRAGSLDDPSGFRPTMDIYTASAQPWDLMSPDTLKFARLPSPKEPE